MNILIIYFRSRLNCIILYLVFVFRGNFKREMILWFSSTLMLSKFTSSEASRLEITRSASVLCSSAFTLSSAFLASQTWLRLGWLTSHKQTVSVLHFMWNVKWFSIGFFQHKERLVVGNRKQHLLSLCFRNSSVKTGALNPGKSSSSSLSFNFPDTVCLCFRPRMCSLLLWRLLKYWLHGLQ